MELELIKFSPEIFTHFEIIFGWSWVRGGSFTKIVRGCACRTSKIWLSLYQFFAKFPTHQYTIFERKAPDLIWIKLGAFYNNLPQIHPIYVIWAPPSLMKTPPIAIPNFAKKCPKRQAHIRIPCQCENPPPRVGYCGLLGCTTHRPADIGPIPPCQCFPLEVSHLW